MARRRAILVYVIDWEAEYAIFIMGLAFTGVGTLAYHHGYFSSFLRSPAHETIWWCSIAIFWIGIIALSFTWRKILSRPILGKIIRFMLWILAAASMGWLLYWVHNR